jgi:tRNA (guanine-N7-)-methyltransferase
MSAENSENSKPFTHRIRSFVVRGGKITPSQQRALQELLPKYQLESDQPFEVERVFGNKQPVWLDIGFGNGESLLHAARHYPEVNLVGIEVHPPGVGHLLLEMEKNGLENIRLYQEDAVEVLEKAFADESLDAVHIFFPDPWHKKRHHKRRLIRPDFVALLEKKIRPGGRLHLATDWAPYAEAMHAVMEQFPAFKNQAAAAGEPPLSSARPPWRPVTKFERRGQKLGHKSHDLIYTRV